MNTENKAKELAKLEGSANNPVVSNLIEKKTLEMAKWKEEKLIEKAVEWLKDMACQYSHWEYNGDTYEQEIVVDTEKMIEDFKQAMKEE